MPLYIALSLLGFVVSAMYLKERFSVFLLLNCLFGGVAAGLSCVYFYVIQGHGYGFRDVAPGLWNVVIPTAQAVGALALITAFLGFRFRLKPWGVCCVVLVLFGYGVFLIFNQTRWVWLSLMGTFLVVGLISKNRSALAIFAFSMVFFTVAAFFYPAVFLSRGFSYRPELWMGGVELMLQNWKHGLGFQEYLIEIKSLHINSRQPHNMFLDIGIRFGLLGFLLWAGLWIWAGWNAFRQRNSHLGLVAVALWLYSGVVVLTEGIAPWEKPSPIWFVTWLPIAMVLVLDVLTAPKAIKPM